LSLFCSGVFPTTNTKDFPINYLPIHTQGGNLVKACLLPRHHEFKKMNMKNSYLLLLLLSNAVAGYAQFAKLTDLQRQSITALINQYSQARESRDTLLLKKILTIDVDQLVSTGEWRTGMAEAVQGMMKSSATNPESRTLTVDKIRLVTTTSAIVDCRYEIANATGDPKKMWSSFIVVADKGAWKISAIRNMLPAAH
jgi:hypothetical protein